MAMAVTVCSDSAGQAAFVMNFILLFSLAFTGFLVNVDSIPASIRWVRYLSVFYYAFEAIFTSQLVGEAFDFEINIAGFVSNVPGVKGEVYLGTLGFSPGKTTFDIALLIVIYGAMVLLTMGLFMMRLPRATVVGGRAWWRRGVLGRIF
jgi:ATP-binding cassette, subfamily G (WHITE), member 2